MIEPAGDSAHRMQIQTVGLFVAFAAALAIVDVVIARFLTGQPGWAIAADFAMTAVFVLAVRSMFVATMLASTVSMAVSALWLIGDNGNSDRYRGWPGLVEIGVLALLTGLCVRNLARFRAVAAVAGIAAAIIMICVVRIDAEVSVVVIPLLAVTFMAVAAASVYLRGADTNRRLRSSQARQTERVEISRELHDVIGHHMTGIILQAQAAQMLITDRPDLASNAMAEIEIAGADALASMRYLVRHLRSDDRTPSQDSSTATIHDFADLADGPTAGAAPVDLHLDAAAHALPAALIASLHRIALESVTNARRHAVDPTRVSVRLETHDNHVALTVDNDGTTGQPPDTSSGYGLIGIRERVQALGGTLDAGPRPGGGWTVRTEIPFSGNAR